MTRYLLILWLRVLARFNVGNARRRLGQFNRKRGAASLTSNGVPESLSVHASVDNPIPNTTGVSNG